VSRANVRPSGKRSKFEESIGSSLDDAGMSYKYEAYQYEYQEPLRKNLASCDDCGSTNLSRTGWYTPDFFLANGVIIETKGRFTAADRRKMLAIKEGHPHLDIKMLFMRDNKIHKRSETKYSDWCEANGYDYSVGTLKKEWLDEKEEISTT
jgi:hypothetical protein